MKCTARRTNGEPCNAWAIKGGTVCRSHGGSIKHVRDAANRRLAEQEAAKTVATLGALLASAGESAELSAPRDALLAYRARYGVA